MQKCTLNQKLKQHAYRTACVSFVAFFLMSLVLFGITVRRGIEHTAIDFLLSGRKSIDNLQKELGFRDPIGITGTLDYIEKKFGLRNNYKGSSFIFEKCLIHRTFEENDHRVDLCMTHLTEYSLVMRLRTYKDTIFLSFVKPVDFNFIWEYMPILALFSLFFTLLACYGYAQLSLLIIAPIRNIHGYLAGKGTLELDDIQEYKDLVAVIDSSHEAVKNKAVVETLNIVVHNVQKPFFMIRNSLEQASFLKGQELESYIKKISPQIKSSSETAEKIIDSVLDTASGGKITKELTDIASPIEGAIAFFSFDDMVEKVFQHKSLLRLDRVKILESVMNLFSNIEDIRKKNPNIKIWVHTTECKKFVSFTVGNTGSCIPSSDVNKIFQNFYTKGKERGRGLGLFVAKKYIELHGGSIWVESSENTVEFKARIPKEAAV